MCSEIDFLLFLNILGLFGDIPNNIIDQIISKGEVMWCAGGFQVEEQLFQPYILKIDGEITSVRGLSIPIVKKLIELHDGKVWIEDNPKGGSIFTVQLPKER